MKELFNHFFAPFQPKDNPAQVNINSVQMTLNSLIPMIEPTKEFYVEKPLPIVLRNNDPILPNLIYACQTGSTMISDYVFIQMQIMFKGASLAARTWVMNEPRREFGGTKLLADTTSCSFTSPDWEGNQFGIALIQTNHMVMHHMLSHMEPLWGNFSIQATIEDRSQGRQRKRNKWTTEMARDLGFRQIDQRNFIKLYERE